MPYKYNLIWLEREYYKMKGACDSNVASVAMYLMTVRSGGVVPVDNLIKIGHIVAIGAWMWLSRGIQ